MAAFEEAHSESIALASPSKPETCTPPREGMLSERRPLWTH